MHRGETHWPQPGKTLYELCHQRIACLATLKSCTYNKTVCQWMTIYTLPSWGLSILTKKKTAVICVMQSSFNELGTLVSGKSKLKPTKTNS